MSDTTSDPDLSGTAATPSPAATGTATADLGAGDTPKTAEAGTSRTTPGSIAAGLAQASSTNWTGEAADAIERAVGAVRRQTVDRAQGISRAAVYGLIAVGFGLPALLLILLGLFRLVNSIYLEFDIGVWATWLTLGGIWLLCGLFLWAKRNARVVSS